MIYWAVGHSTFSVEHSNRGVVSCGESGHLLKDNSIFFVQRFACKTKVMTATEANNNAFKTTVAVGSSNDPNIIAK